MVSAPRQFAARFLSEPARVGDFAEHRLERNAAFARLAPVDRRLARELIWGVLRWQTTLDWLIAQKVDGRRLQPRSQTLLRLGLYQLFWLTRIPDHAVVDQTVALARASGLSSQTGFLNAVLRGYTRQRDDTQRALRELKLQDPATGWSFPRWLVDRWAKVWSSEELQRWLLWNNTAPKFFARLDPRNGSKEELVHAWSEDGLSFQERTFPWAPSEVVFELESLPAFSGWRSFQEGRFYIQDPSTLLAVTVLDPQPDEVILDYCAAPGGKTLMIADRLQQSGSIVAHDASPERLELLKVNCRRHHADQVRPVSSLPEPEVHFDRILVDAPCSNTGVLRRRVELRWRLEPSELQRLAETQLGLLRDAARRLKPGGVLVYSTCSVEPEENHGVVQRFMEGSNGWTLESQTGLHPLRDEVDGAFVARFRRTC